MDSGIDNVEGLSTNALSLDEIRERIQKYSNAEGEQEVKFIDSPAEGKSDEALKVENAANVIFDGLLLALDEIGEFSVEKAKKNLYSSKEYEQVARGIEPAAHVCRGLAEDRIPLIREEHKERAYAADQDRVYIFNAADFVLDDTPFKRMGVFVRPELYREPLEVRNRPRRPGVRTSEIALPKMQIIATPKYSEDSSIVVRVDRADARRDYEITYDIIVNNRGRDLMRDLSFAGTEAAQGLNGRNEGHHFSSHWRAEDLGVTFTQVLEAYAQKLAHASKKK